MEKPMTIKIRYLALLAAVLFSTSAFAVDQKFDVYKEWGGNVPSNTAVQVNITCTSGDSGTINQTTSLTSGTHVTFTVLNVEDPTDCTITETTGLDHYTASYDVTYCDSNSCLDSSNDFNGCKFVDTYNADPQTCVIHNDPEPATVTITKSWIVEGGDQGYDPNYQIKLRCDDDETIWYDGQSYGGKVVVWAKASSTPKDFEFTIPRPGYPASNCTIIEVNNDSVVESDMSDCVPKDGYQYNSQGHYDRTKNLVDIEVSAGDEQACEIVNTVFFEGIPTLNQYGMAILALLMLGVGFVGFRRFV